MLNFFKKKNLHDVLNAKKRITVKGVLFTIKKLNSLDFLDGSRVMSKKYDTYESKKGNDRDVDFSAEKIKDYYRDIFMSSVVKPKLSRKDDSEDIFVDEIFKDWEMAEVLHLKILEFTHGKKKIKSSILQNQS